MALSSIIKDKVARRDLSGIRDSVFMATMKDPGFSQGGAVAELLEFCFSNGISRAELFQPDDGREIPSEVTNDSLAKICASLRTNFSERKLAAAQKMGRMLYPTPKTEERAREPRRERSFGTQKKVLAAAISIAAMLLLLLLVIIKACGKSIPPANAAEGLSANIQAETEMQKWKRS